MSKPICYETVWTSLPGPRDNLEDFASALELRLPGEEPVHVALSVVVDGVGGNCYGEVASHQGATTILSTLSALLTAGACSEDSSITQSNQIEQFLGMSFETANACILEQAERQPILQGMSTTAVCAVMLRERLYLGWAGDSRGYILTADGLERITRDHSEVQRLVDSGMLHPEMTNDHPLAHMIHNYLGQKDGFEMETTSCDLEAGDMLLLCSDGLTDVIPDAEIENLLGQGRNAMTPFSEISGQLARAALEAGTTDNVTVLISRNSPESLYSEIDRTATGQYPEAVATFLSTFLQEV